MIKYDVIIIGAGCSGLSLAYRLLNTNKKALDSYKIARKRKLSEIEDINNMKKDIAELKEMIKTLLGKQNG